MTRYRSTHMRVICGLAAGVLLLAQGATAQDISAVADKPDCAATSSCDALSSDSGVERKSIFTQKVSDNELGTMRAGFFNAAGAQFDFGASVTTLVNGTLALESTLNWTPTGLAVQQVSGSTPIASMEPDPLGQQASTVSGGQTQVFSNLTNGQLQNFVINSANGQTIAQNTNIQLTIYNFADWQRQLAENSVAARLAADTMTAAGLATH